MTDIVIEQALFGRENGKFTAWGQSAGFHEDWLPLAQQLMRGFGDRPVGVACPLAIFARPLGEKHVAVVQAADQPGGSLGFHFLVFQRTDYENSLGDPFQLARKLPASWQQRGTLGTQSLPSTALRLRTVADVRQVLQRVKANALSEDCDVDEQAPALTVDNSESPALLGGTQVLVDGGKLMFQRPQPDPQLLEGLWTLLPYSTRCRLWPASFAFSNELKFDAVVVPQVGPDDDFRGYTSEEQAMDYPEGRYELNLQIAAETGDQHQLDGLLSRRSVSETWKLGWKLLILMVVLVAASGLIHMFVRPSPVSPGEIRLRTRAAVLIIGVREPLSVLAMLDAGTKAKVAIEEVEP